jgi:hypothetical protein
LSVISSELLDLGILPIALLLMFRTGILLATTIIYSYIEIATKEGTPGLAAMGDLL